MKKKLYHPDKMKPSTVSIKKNSISNKQVKTLMKTVDHMLSKSKCLIQNALIFSMLIS